MSCPRLLCSQHATVCLVGSEHSSKSQCCPRCWRARDCLPSRLRTCLGARDVATQTHQRPWQVWLSAGLMKQQRLPIRSTGKLAMTSPSREGLATW